MSLVWDLDRFAEHCETEYLAEKDIDSPDSLALVLDAIRNCRANLATLYDEVEKDLLAVMGGKSIEVTGLGLVEAKKQTKRTQWQNDDLYKRVVSRALDERQLDETTGEFEAPEQAVARVIGACARPSWRLTALRALGLDPDEYCSVQEDGWSIRLPGRDAV